MVIVHIIQRDRFTSGYINFFKSTLVKYEHYFFIGADGFELDLINENGVFYLRSYSELLSSENLTLLCNADKIIVSGAFWSGEDAFYDVFKKRELLKKTFFHFWGGDFYCFRDQEFINPIHLRTYTLQKRQHNRVRNIYRRCAGLVFLIDGEYENFHKILNIRNRHYTAPMPGDPGKRVDYSTFEQNKNETLRIILGNSATESNCHKEIIGILASRFANESFDLYCPLSYGSEEYRDKVIEYGSEQLKERFHPVVEYMDKEEYDTFLSSFDIGIFNNDRQQAMGNIRILLGMGKKVYLRSDTSMWNRYIQNGYLVHDVQELREITFSEFRENPREESGVNKMTFHNRFSGNNAGTAWLKLLDISV